MSDEKRTALDAALDAMLRRLAAAEVRPDLRGRVLARLGRPAPRAAVTPLRLAFAVAVLAALLLAAGLLRLGSSVNPGSRLAEGPRVTQPPRPPVSAPPVAAARVPAAAVPTRPVVAHLEARPPRLGAPPALAMNPLPSPDPLAVPALDESSLRVAPETVAVLEEPALTLSPLASQEN